MSPPALYQVLFHYHYQVVEIGANVERVGGTVHHFVVLLAPGYPFGPEASVLSAKAASSKSGIISAYALSLVSLIVSKYFQMPVQDSDQERI